MTRRTVLAWVALAPLVALASCAPAAPPPDDGKVRVACVGASITYGAGIEDREANCYPAVLQRLLGVTYAVRNFGVSGRTVMSSGDGPYVKEKAYRDALAFRPHVVVILLGTNDGKPNNWKHAAAFAGDYTALVQSFRALDSKPTVYPCLLPPVFPEAFGVTDERLTTEINPKVAAVAKELNLTVIDLHAALAGKPELFPDKVHPNAAGAKLMAETVYKALTAGK